jgi:metal-dependent amidase/aminoacylase/carboxypeptidase family protein
MTPWPEEAVRLLPDLVQLRRAIHSEPELGLRTPKTAAKIMSALAGLPLEYRHGPSTDGIVAVLRGERRYGCAADARGHRFAVCITGGRRDACLWS